MSLYAKRSGKRFILGDAVKIKVEKANLEQKQLDFSLVWEDPVQENQPVKKSTKRVEHKKRGGK